MSTSRPEVSVLITSYNQEKYIRQALDSVLMQAADFDFEVVVADDGSRDSTPEIIEEYRARNPEIRALPSEGNLGVTRNYRRGLDACRGEFIAVLEGDDFWISPRKLEKLHAFLRRHPESPFCFHRIIRLEEGSERSAVFPVFEGAAQPDTFTARQLARRNFVGNVSACMYRRDSVARLDPKIWGMTVREWLFNIAVARQGPIGYVPEILSVYRVNPGGVWTRKTEAEQASALIELLDAYNEFLGFEFDAEFAAHRRVALKSLRRAGRPFARRLGRRIKALLPTGLRRGLSD